MIRQGKPDAGSPIHMIDEQPETMRRKRELGIETHKAFCGNGSFHLVLTRIVQEVTCKACLEKIDRTSRNEE